MAEIERIRNCLKGFYLEALPELNRMIDGKLEDNVIEAVLEELVEIAVVGQEECAAKAQIVLSRGYV